MITFSLNNQMKRREFSPSDFFNSNSPKTYTSSFFEFVSNETSFLKMEVCYLGVKDRLL
jgi:hypothetical protein